MKILMKLLLAIALSSTIVNAKDLNSNQLLNKMIQVYGGEKNLQQLNDYKQLWNIEAKVSDTNGTDSREVMMPSYLYTRLAYPHKLEVRVLDKGRGIKKFSQRTIEAKGPMLDAMKLQLMRLFHPLELKKRLKYITLKSTPTQYILSLKENGLTSEYYVSKKNFLIEKVVGKLQMRGQKMEFLTLYQNYQRVHGVMMPHREVKYAGSVNTAIMRLQITKFKHENKDTQFIKLNKIT